MENNKNGSRFATEEPFAGLQRRKIVIVVSSSDLEQKIADKAKTLLGDKYDVVVVNAETARDFVEKDLAERVLTVSYADSTPVGLVTLTAPPVRPLMGVLASVGFSQKDVATHIARVRVSHRNFRR